MNQPPPLEPYNLFAADPVLQRAAEREGAGRFAESLAEFGAVVGSEQVIEWGFDANRHSPELVTHDRFGERIDEVRYHPSYHSLLDLSVGHGIHAPRLDATPGDGSYVARNVRMNLLSQIEVGHNCPTSMTGAVLPALQVQPDVAQIWEPRVSTTSYDPRLINPADKTGCLIGMGLTERQGGSDVRANTSTAVATGRGGPGETYLLTGHKWFTSAPMCDAFMVLAHAPAGLSCFLLPRVLPDGTRNEIRINRLKDKLGNRANASAEIEYTDVTAWLIGDEGRGINTIIKMVNGTRLDVTNWAVALMRQATSQAAWHCAHRQAFGSALIDKPLMQNVLADLELETAIGTLMVMRTSGAYDRAGVSADETAFVRMASAVGKYWLTKRSTPVVREALECVGGNGYVEESILPRLYREAPLNSIWEGSGNVIVVDVLRALERAPESADAFIEEIEGPAGRDAVLARELARLKDMLAAGVEPVAGRRLVELMATCWGAALAVEFEPMLADAYVRSRLGGDQGAEFGALDPALDLASIARSSLPGR